MARGRTQSWAKAARDGTRQDAVLGEGCPRWHRAGRSPGRRLPAMARGRTLSWAKGARDGKGQEAIHGEATSRSLVPGCDPGRCHLEEPCAGMRSEGKPPQGALGFWEPRAAPRRSCYRDPNEVRRQSRGGRRERHSTLACVSRSSERAQVREGRGDPRAGRVCRALRTRVCDAGRVHGAPSSGRGCRTRIRRRGSRGHVGARGQGESLASLHPGPSHHPVRCGLPRR
jgi:hypothetical protein